jgi:RNA polymerase sigma-70 factor, ECF subfamily
MGKHPRTKSNQEYVRIVQRALGNRTESRLRDDLQRLALYCQPPDPAAKNATDLDERMKQFTWWPQENLLARIEDGVLAIALTQRKYPERRLWKNFELVNRRKKKLQLVDQINDLVSRARERFTKANFSDLEALSSERRENTDARNLLRDIDRIKKDVGAAKTIDWAQYFDFLARFSDDGHFMHARGNDTAIACYARVLELIIDHMKWEKLREDSEALVLWLLRIGHPSAEGRDGLEPFNRGASFRALFEKIEEESRVREAKLVEFRQSGKVIKKSKEDIEDERLMDLVHVKRDANALAQLRERHKGRVKEFVHGILRSDPAVDEITDRVFVQVWKNASKYVPIAKFSTWLLEIAKNLALNEKKRAEKEKERVEFAYVGEDAYERAKLPRTDGGDREHTLQQTPAQQDSEPLSRALSQLSPPQRRVIEALNGYGCERKTRREIADELRITSGEVEDLEDEALACLRQSLDS